MQEKSTDSPPDWVPQQENFQMDVPTHWCHHCVGRATTLMRETLKAEPGSSKERKQGSLHEGLMAWIRGGERTACKPYRSVWPCQGSSKFRKSTAG